MHLGKACAKEDAWNVELICIKQSIEADSSQKSLFIFFAHVMQRLNGYFP